MSVRKVPEPVARLLKAAKLVVKVYPYDWQKCIEERKKPCRQCYAIANLDAAVKAVKP